MKFQQRDKVFNVHSPIQQGLVDICYKGLDGKEYCVVVNSYGTFLSTSDQWGLRPAVLGTAGAIKVLDGPNPIHTKVAKYLQS